LILRSLFHLSGLCARVGAGGGQQSPERINAEKQGRCQVIKNTTLSGTNEAKEERKIRKIQRSESLGPAKKNTKKNRELVGAWGKSQNESTTERPDLCGGEGNAGQVFGRKGGRKETRPGTRKTAQGPAHALEGEGRGQSGGTSGSGATDGAFPHIQFGKDVKKLSPPKKFHKENHGKRQKLNRTIKAGGPGGSGGGHFKKSGPSGKGNRRCGRKGLRRTASSPRNGGGVNLERRTENCSGTETTAFPGTEVTAKTKMKVMTPQ